MTGLQLQTSCTFHGQDNRTIHQLTSGHRSPVVNANYLLTRLTLFEVSWKVALSRNIVYNPRKFQSKRSILTSNHNLDIRCIRMFGKLLMKVCYCCFCVTWWRFKVFHVRRWKLAVHQFTSDEARQISIVLPFVSNEFFLKCPSIENKE